MQRISMMYTSVGVLLLLTTFLVIRPALAQMVSSTDATSTATTTPAMGQLSGASSTDATSTASSDADSIAAASSTDTISTPSSEPTTTPEARPNFALVHIVGKKYVDYFTDGTNVRLSWRP
jgi:hypothetical protein